MYHVHGSQFPKPHIISPPPPPCDLSKLKREAEEAKQMYINKALALEDLAKERNATQNKEDILAAFPDEATKKEVEQMFDGLMYDKYGMWLPSMDIDENGGVALNIEVDEDYGAHFIDD